MLYAPSYANDDKAQLHEKMRELSAELAATFAGAGHQLGFHIVSATPLATLRENYDDGTWDRDRFAAAHILFPEPDDGYE